MQKLFVVALAALSLGSCATAQQANSTDVLKKASSILNTIGGKNSLSNDEIIAGLKEALVVGTNNSSGKLSAVDGFMKDAAVKLIMPEEARKVEARLRQIGMGKLVDDAILSMNRAAEDAAKSAAPIFISAVKKMTVQDAMGILRGTDTAATGYLRKATSPELVVAFKPVIETSLQKTGATKYWKEVFDVYNKFALKPVNSDLSGYVTDRAMNGIFYYVAEEEKNIRANPAARVSDILKKVFGSR